MFATEGSFRDAFKLFHVGAEGIVGGISDGGVADGIALGLVLLAGGAGEVMEPGNVGGEQNRRYLRI